MYSTAVMVNEGFGRKSLSSLRTIRKNVASKEILLLGAFLIILQIADGILTMKGVQAFGTSMEGNLILRALMNKIGHIEALAFSKLVCIAVIVRLTLIAKQYAWVKQAMGAVCCFYLFAAVFPWTYILSASN